MVTTLRRVDVLNEVNDVGRVRDARSEAEKKERHLGESESFEYTVAVLRDSLSCSIQINGKRRLSGSHGGSERFS